MSDNGDTTYHRIIHELSSLPWVEAGTFNCQEGMSLIRFSVLVHAINVFLNENRPKTAKDFNFQAELKAASHWHWSDDDGRCLELGPHDDRRVKLAAENTFDKWVKELDKVKNQSPAEPSEISGADSLSSDEDETVSGNKPGTCSTGLCYEIHLF